MTSAKLIEGGTKALRTKFTVEIDLGDYASDVLEDLKKSKRWGFEANLIDIIENKS